jgi:hypothetical protein
MTSTLPRGSATIYQFPARGRFATAGNGDQSDSAINLMAARAAKIVSGGAWYHEAAIHDDELGRSN